MKIKRLKKAQKILDFYKNSFDIRAPYTVLLDGTFCHASCEGKVDINLQLPKYFGGQTNCVTTQCIILEAEKLAKIAKNLRKPYLRVKDFPVHSCGHEGKPVPASHCIKAMLQKANPKKYVVASQDKDVRTHIHRNVPGTPILYLHWSAPTLERPSALTETQAQAADGMTQHEANTLQSLKRKYNCEEQKDEEPVKKKKKKFRKFVPRKEKTSGPQEGSEKRGRKRKRRDATDVHVKKIIAGMK